MKTIRLIILSVFSVTLASAQVTPKQGQWRGTFKLFNGAEAPFNFELKDKNAYLINGKERFEIKGVYQKNDSLFIPIDIFDAVIKAKVESAGKLSGIFRRLNSTIPDISFTAEQGKTYRFFENPGAASVSLHGNWDVVIGTSPNKLVGVFTQTGNKLSGTFLSKTGDYRFLEGSVQGDEFFLSAFSGSSPSLIKGKISGDELTAEYITIRGSQPVKGTRNEKAALPDAYSLTKIKEGTTFDFTFPDAFTGKPVSLKDARYKGKVVVVTILGSWCPNCIDEATFLSPWYKANKDRGVEIIGLSFERKNDAAFAKTRLEALKTRFGIDYPLLFAGLSDNNYVKSVLPSLTDFISFPTTIFIDKNGNVSKIHTGYSGPATGKYYEAFVKEFNHDIDTLLGSDAGKGQTGK